MTHRMIRFLTGTWWLRWTRGDTCLEGAEVDGSCDPAWKKGRKWIYVREGLKPKRELEVLIHEMCHAADPRAGEDAIEDQARVIANTLWDLGYRRQP